MPRKIGVLVILILLTFSLTVSAQEDSPAKQLMRGNWDEVEEGPGPVIIYELHLIALNSQMTSLLAGSGKATMDSQGRAAQGSYSILQDRTVLSWISDYRHSFHGELEGQQEAKSSELHCTAWLVTMAGKPVAVELDETAFTRERDLDELTGPRQLLKITMAPLEVNLASGSVLTDLSIDYQNVAGALGSVKLANYLKPEIGEPLAVVVQNGQASGGSVARSFALYASATIMAQDELPSQGALVPVGSIGGLQRLFSPTTLPVPSSMVFYGDVGQGDGSFRARLGGELIQGPYRARGQIHGIGGELGYGILAGYDFYKELGVAFHLGREVNGEGALRLGLSDHIQLSQDMHIALAYLPFSYKFHKGFDRDYMVQFLLKLQREAWGSWYQCTYAGGDFNHQVGVAKNLKGPWSIQVVWSKGPEEGHYYGLGMMYRLE